MMNDFKLIMAQLVIRYWNVVSPNRSACRPESLCDASDADSSYRRLSRNA